MCFSEVPKFMFKNKRTLDLSSSLCKSCTLFGKYRKNATQEILSALFSFPLLPLLNWLIFQLHICILISTESWSS